MAYEPGKTRTWDRTTLNDGDLFDDEFERVYANLNDLNSRFEELLADHNELKKSARIVGEKFWLDEYRAPSEGFPAFCISQPDSVITSVNWPDLVSHLYAKPLRYTHGGLDISSFRVTGWDVADSGGGKLATLTFPAKFDATTTGTIGSLEFQIVNASGIEAGMFVKGGGGSNRKYSYSIMAVNLSSNTVTIDRPYHQELTSTIIDYYPLEERVLEALEEDINVNGVAGTVNARSITLPANYGNIPAGDYTIQTVDAAARNISFICPTAVATGSGTQAGAVEFYPHRVSGSSSMAQHFAVQGRAFVTPQDEFGEVFAGLRRRDRFQGHWHFDTELSTYRGNSGGGPGLYTAWTGTGSAEWNLQIMNPIKDNMSNYEPRTGYTTDPRTEGNYAYIWGKTYTP